MGRGVPCGVVTTLNGVVTEDVLTARWFRDGRLLGYPRQPKVRSRVLALLAPTTIGTTERVDERTFTARLAELTDDPIRLRRELVDRGLIERTPDGGAYWLGAGRPLPEG